MIRYLMILLLAIGFVSLHSYSYGQSTIDTNKAKLATETKSDNQQAEIRELQTQMEILKGTKDSYIMNVATIIGVVTLIVMTITFYFGYIVPKRYGKQFDEKIQKLEDKFNEKTKKITGIMIEITEMTRDKHSNAMKTILKRNMEIYHIISVIINDIKNLQHFSILCNMIIWINEITSIEYDKYIGESYKKDDNDNNKSIDNRTFNYLLLIEKEIEILIIDFTTVQLKNNL